MSINLFISVAILGIPFPTTGGSAFPTTGGSGESLYYKYIGELVKCQAFFKNIFQNIFQNISLDISGEFLYNNAEVC